MASFSDRYGSWALIAGASEGLGAAFAQALAGRGLNLVLVARRRALLEALAADCRSRHGVEVLALEADLATPEALPRIVAGTASLELGLLLYNAAYAPLGDFAGLDPAGLRRVVDVNVHGPLDLARALLPPMLARGRGGLLLMTSLAGNQGSPRLAAYAASKAFNRVLAESLWAELRGQGIAVLAVCAGAIRTPGLATAATDSPPGSLDPDEVAERALAALGHGPVFVPGFVNKLAAFFMGRLLPRRAAIAIMGGNTNKLRGSSGGQP